MDWRTDRCFDFSIKILYNYNIKNFMAIHDSLETGDHRSVPQKIFIIQDKSV